MPSDYEAITRHNERQLGLDTASRKTQICMYSDSTHFIYEILQNADDYGATEVAFTLSRNELRIEYDGEPFSEKHVEAITYFGKSTSCDDLVKTGRFGVGFKSVFAFTATPTIISGEESFQIYKLYRVREHPVASRPQSSHTCIILPFNHDTERPDYVEHFMSREEAYSRISARLTGLSINTLLFTKNIRKVIFETGKREGYYLREDKVEGSTRRTRITDGKLTYNYLVFSMVPHWRNQEHKAVEIAFAISDEGQLVQTDAFLYVLFATTQETHLKFILNGPFRTNPSRETISEEDIFNRHLVKEICALTRDALPRLKEMGTLTTQFLACLPNSGDNLREFYTPLRDAIFTAFHEIDLVPTDDSQFATARNVLLGPAAIREVVKREEIPFFVGTQKACWVKGVQQHSRADLFLRDLGIQHWGWTQLESTLRKKYGRSVYYSHREVDEEDRTWLKGRTDSWLQKLYLLLNEGISKGECSDLSGCGIIRVREGGAEVHTRGSRAYFPRGRGYRDLPQVKSSILQARTSQGAEKIRESLVALGVSDIGKEEKIDLLLETFYSDESPAVTKQQNLKHMRVFVDWWKKEGGARKFKHYPIFLAAGERGFFKPEDCYVDSPLKKSGLHVIYSKRSTRIQKKEKLTGGYRKLSKRGFCDFAVACGVADRLSIECLYCSTHHPQRGEMTRYSRRVRETGSQIDDDYYIPNLANLLGLRSRAINLLIWDTVREADPKVFVAAYRPNQKYATRTHKSSLVLTLADCEWIPDRRGHLHRPSDVTRERLHRSFKYDNRNGWLEEIGFGEKAKKETEAYKQREEMASALGIPIEVSDYLATLPEEECKQTIAKVKELIRLEKAAHKRAERLQSENISYREALAGVFSIPGAASHDKRLRGRDSSKDPSRRRAKVSESIASDIRSEGKQGDRFSFAMRKRWKGKNDRVRVALLEWYGGRCQICGSTFTQRSGEPYFEGLYLVPYRKAEWLDRVGNVLCLCALHSAMFQHGAKEPIDDIIEQIAGIRPQSEGGEHGPSIRMNLCGKEVRIGYVDNHLIDLQEMIRVSRDTEASG